MLYETYDLEAPLEILANRFRGLWKLDFLQDFLLELVKEIRMTNTWIHGWLAIGETLKYDRDSMESNRMHQLEVLFEQVKPDSLYDQIRLYVLMEAGNIYDEVTGEDNGRNTPYESTGKIAENLGARASNDLALIKTILPELLSCRVPYTLKSFGLGVGKHCSSQNLEKLWQIIRDALSENKSSVNNTLFIEGYIIGLKSITKSFVENILNETLKDDVIVDFLPALQGAVGYDNDGINRLLESLKNDSVSLKAYSYLIYENGTITNRDLIKLLDKILGKESGIFLCLDILNWRVDKTDVYSSQNTDILEYVFSTVKEYDFSVAIPDWYRDGYIYNLKFLVDRCFATPKAYQASQALLENFKKYFNQHNSIPKYMDTLLKTLIEHQAGAVLDILVDDESVPENDWLDFRRIRDFGLMISTIPNKQLLEWCQIGSIERYHRLARYINPVTDRASINDDKWLELIEQMAANGIKEKVLERVSSSFYPSFWMGRRIIALNQYIRLLDKLINVAPDLKTWANKEQAQLRKLIKQLNDRDYDWESEDTPQSFE